MRYAACMSILSLIDELTSLASMMTLENRSPGTGICRSGDTGIMDSPYSLIMMG